MILLFESVIDGAWYLAALMPIIAAMGGNAGTQALAVTVRRLAIGAGPLEKKRAVLGKELATGLANGLALAMLAAALTWGAVQLGAGAGSTPLHANLPIVVFFAMIGTIVVAGFSGAFIPTILDRLGIDPAVASSVFVTTLTDLFGFFLLLGLAQLLLL